MNIYGKYVNFNIYFASFHSRVSSHDFVYFLGNFSDKKCRETKYGLVRLKFWFLFFFSMKNVISSFNPNEWKCGIIRSSHLIDGDLSWCPWLCVDFLSFPSKSANDSEHRPRSCITKNHARACQISANKKVEPVLLKSAITELCYCSVFHIQFKQLIDRLLYTQIHNTRTI